MNNFGEKTLNDAEKAANCSDNGLLNCGVKLEDGINGSSKVCDSGPLEIVSSESCHETTDPGIIKVDALTEENACSELNIIEAQSNKDSAELIDLSAKTSRKIEEDKKISDETVKPNKEDLSYKNDLNEVTQATLTTEIIRASVAEKDDFLIQQKHESKITATHFVKELLVESQVATAANSTIKNSQPQCMTSTLPATTALDARNLSASIWIRNITNTTKAVEIKALFSKYGKVVTAKIFTTKNKLSPTCFGFVVLSDSSSADLCVQNLNRMNFKGRVINVEKADRSNLSQINKNTNGGAFNSSIQTQPSEDISSKSNIDSIEEKVKTNSTVQAIAPEKLSIAGTKRSPRPRVISTSNISSKESRNSSKWRASSYEKRGYVNPRSYSYGNKRIMGIRQGRAGRLTGSGGRNMRNSNSGSSAQYRTRMGSNERSTIRHVDERQNTLRNKPSNSRTTSRRSQVDNSRDVTSYDKEEFLRLMRRKEDEHRKKEEKLKMEREREKIRFEREKLEREKLEIETLRLQAQLQAATQFQFSLPPNCATGLGDSSQQFGDRGFSHRHERTNDISSSKRRGVVEIPNKKNDVHRGSSSKHNERKDRPNRSRPSSRSDRGRVSEASRSKRYQDRSRSPLRRLDTSRHNNDSNDHQTRFQSNKNVREHTSKDVSTPLQSKFTEMRASGFTDNYDNKRYFYNTGIGSTSKDSFAADRDRQVMPVRFASICDRQISSPQSTERTRRDYFTGNSHYNTSGTSPYADGGTLRSDQYTSRIQQQTQNMGAQSSSISTDDMFRNVVSSSFNVRNNSIPVIGYDNTQHPTQYSSGRSTYYQQGTVAYWDGQLNANGNKERVASSYYRVNNGEADIGNSTTWNSGGGWNETFGSNSGTGTSARYSNSYNKSNSSYSTGRRY